MSSGDTHLSSGDTHFIWGVRGTHTLSASSGSSGDTHFIFVLLGGCWGEVPVCWG